MSKTIENQAAGGRCAPPSCSAALPPICWVHRPHDLRSEIEEADDLCPECCEKRVDKYRSEYPEHAADILADGGWEQCRESEGLAVCAECGCDLGCYLLDTFDDLSDWTEEDRCIDTPEKSSRALARLQAQDEQNNKR